MAYVKKYCPECGPVETRYSNCPRCWGPVARRELEKPKKEPEPEPNVMETLTDKVLVLCLDIRRAKISEEERQKLIALLSEKSKLY